MPTFASARFFNIQFVFIFLSRKQRWTVHCIDFAELFNFALVFSLVPCDMVVFGKSLEKPSFVSKLQSALPTSIITFSENNKFLIFLSPPYYPHVTAASQKNSDSSAVFQLSGLTHCHISLLILLLQ